jgi:hypothetical protein
VFQNHLLFHYDLNVPVKNQSTSEVYFDAYLHLFITFPFYIARRIHERNLCWSFRSRIMAVGNDLLLFVLEIPSSPVIQIPKYLHHGANERCEVMSFSYFFTQIFT